jgi:hypothetical protein
VTFEIIRSNRVVPSLGASPVPDHGQPAIAVRPSRTVSLGPWSDAIPFGRLSKLTRCRFRRAIEEPADTADQSQRASAQVTVPPSDHWRTVIRPIKLPRSAHARTMEVPCRDRQSPVCGKATGRKDNCIQRCTGAESESLRSPCRHSQRGPHLGSSPDAIPSCKVNDHRADSAVLLRSLARPETP